MTSWIPAINVWSDGWAGFAVYRTVESSVLFALVTLVWFCFRRRISLHLVYGLYVLVLVKLLLPAGIPFSALGTNPFQWASTARTHCRDYDGWLLMHNDNSNPVETIQGAMIGEVSWTTKGKHGRGLTFDGGYVQLGNRENDALLPYGPDDSFSWSLWVRPDVIPPNTAENHSKLLSRRRFFHRYDQVNMMIGYLPDGRVDFAVCDHEYPGIRGESTSVINDGKWHHIALVRDTKDKQFRLYIDGTLESTMPDAGWNLSAPCSFRMGEEGETFGGVRRFHGLMDDVRIYDYALAGRQVAAAMHDSPQPLLWRSKIYFAWGGVVAVLLLLQCWRIWKTNRIFQTAGALEPEVAPFDLNELVEKSGIKRTVKWAISGKFSSPAVYGVFRPAVVFPTGFLDHFSDETSRWVIYHELAHVKRYDQLILFVQAVTRALFFFHPLVYLLDFTLNQCRESLCDDFGVEKSGITGAEGGAILAAVAEWAKNKPHNSSEANEIISHKSLLKWRMNRICDDQRKRCVKWDLTSFVLLLAISAVVCSAGIHAKEVDRTWNRISDGGPATRYGQSMAYNNHDHTALLFSGAGGAGSETWQWNGTRWDRISTTSPSPRTGAGMVYDPKHNQTLLFGGRSSDYTTYYNDTWIWDHRTDAWTKMDVKAPEARSGHAMVYDAGNGKVVLFGGRQGAFKQFGDTWEWDGSQWIRTSTSGPSPRYGHAMAFDPIRNTVLLMGGKEKGIVGDAWEWDGAVNLWTKVSQQGPGTLKQRMGHAMAYDPRLNQIVLFGGQSGYRSYNDTWIWDWKERTWMKLLDDREGQASVNCNMVYDERNRIMMRFGGMDLVHNKEQRAGTWVF